MEKFQSLADLLGSEASTPDKSALEAEYVDLVNTKDATEFCRKLVESKMFREYILRGIILGDLPSAMATRVADHGMGKPPERIEHTGKDGEPIVTEVRRVIVHAQNDAMDDLLVDMDKPDVQSKLTH